MFINDLSNCVESTCRLFADDCLLYHEINSAHEHDILQNDLFCLEQWANKWLMQFNPIIVCHIIKVTQKLNPIEITHYVDSYSVMCMKQNT